MPASRIPAGSGGNCPSRIRMAQSWECCRRVEKGEVDGLQARYRSHVVDQVS